jgi:hypothetical protein
MFWRPCHSKKNVFYYRYEGSSLAGYQKSVNRILYVLHAYLAGSECNAWIFVCKSYCFDGRFTMWLQVLCTHECHDYVFQFRGIYVTISTKSST